MRRALILSLVLMAQVLIAQANTRDPYVRMTIYEVAAEVTDAPVFALEGIAHTESDEYDTAIGDDGISIGRFQFNERHHAEREQFYGPYDPRDARQAAYLAGRLFMSNTRYFASLRPPVSDPDTWLPRFWNYAISAHCQGPAGVLKKGMLGWYVERVKVKACIARAWRSVLEERERSGEALGHRW